MSTADREIWCETCDEIRPHDDTVNDGIATCRTCKSENAFETPPEPWTQGPAPSGDEQLEPVVPS